MAASIFAKSVSSRSAAIASRGVIFPSRTAASSSSSLSRSSGESPSSSTNSTSSSAPAGTETGSQEPAGSPRGSPKAATLSAAAASQAPRACVRGYTSCQATALDRRAASSRWNAAHGLPVVGTRTSGRSEAHLPDRHPRRRPGQSHRWSDADAFREPPRLRPRGQRDPHRRRHAERPPERGSHHASEKHGDGRDGHVRATALPPPRAAAGAGHPPRRDPER